MASPPAAWACTAPPAASRRATAPTAPSSTTTTTSSRPTWRRQGQGPGLRRQGGRPGRPRQAAGGDLLLADRGRPHLGQRRAPVHAGSPADRPRRRLRDRGRQGPALLRHLRGRQPVNRQARPHGVPAAGARGRGQQALRAVLRRAVPGDRRGCRGAAAVRPREPASSGPDDEGPGLHQARPGGRRPDHPHGGRPRDRHQVPRLRHRPARGVRGRAGRAPRRGARRRVRRPHPRPGGGPRAAPRRDVHRRLAGDPSRHRRGGVGPGVDGRRDR